MLQISFHTDLLWLVSRVESDNYMMITQKVHVVMTLFVFQELSLTIQVCGRCRLISWSLPARVARRNGGLGG